MWNWFFDGTWGSYIGFAIVAMLYIFAINQSGLLANLLPT